MGWFDEQIKQRIENDDDCFSQAFADMAGAVIGKGFMSYSMADKRKQTMDAVDEILHYYRVSSKNPPDSIKDINELLEFLLRPSGIMRRTVELKDKWYSDGIGPLLAQLKDKTVVALIPSGINGYTYLDYKTGKRVKVNKKRAENFELEAVSFYKPFPLHSLGIKDVLIYLKNALSVSDYIMVALVTLISTLMGTLTAFANNIIFSKVVVVGQMKLFYSAVVLLTGITISGLLINVAKGLVVSRINTKTNVAVQSAAMARVLSLPADFFKNYSSGDLASRVTRFGSICTLIISVVFTTGLSTVFSLIYFIQIFHYAPSLTIPALSVLLITVVFFSITSVLQSKLFQRRIEYSSKESGLVYSYITGIQKIKLTGAEKRAFSKWAELYSKIAKLTYNPPVFAKIQNAIVTLIISLGTVVLYYTSVKSGVSVAEYMTFNVSYGMVSGALLGIAGAVLNITQIKAMFVSVEPILKEVPEISENKKVVTRLSGAIELNNISFRYKDDMPLVIDNLSLKIRSGQYVAIVGTTGCGKSTLMRLMLGFETPQKGAVYYDGKDLDKLELKSVRRNIGTVMQNGSLFAGDIYSNIVISAPWLSLDDAWKAAEMAGVADDIRNMPMGMHTYISERTGGISGGQRQRLMIARAIAPKPKILMFDEATSALDNITQKIVSDSLDSLKCTRIVIAHRLSTIKNCDRIIVLDKGKIIEDGTYDELIAQKGFFTNLVERQQLETNE